MQNERDMTIRTLRESLLEPQMKNPGLATDILVAAFGAEKGDIHWLENTGNWQFTPRALTTIDGALGIADISDISQILWRSSYLRIMKK